MIKMPENLEEALELGKNPCNHCNMGWASISSKHSKSCRDNCNYLKKYLELINNGKENLRF